MTDDKPTREELGDAIDAAIKSLEFRIACTPSGDARNRLTEANILIRAYEREMVAGPGMAEALPKTADGVAVVPGMMLFDREENKRRDVFPFNVSWVDERYVGWNNGPDTPSSTLACDTYSTRAAIEADTEGAKS